MKLEYSIFTAAGERGENEDSVLVIERRNVKAFLLADGLGGHGGGALASKAVVEKISELIDDDCLFSPELLDDCFVKAQKHLMEKQAESESHGMKTTLTILLTDGKQAAWAHVGDSRLYHFRGKRIISRTIDHSMAQTLVSLGDISEAEIKNSPDRNQLTRVMGVEWDSPKHCIDRVKYRLRRRDCFLLCSDGLWERMDETGAVSIFREKSLDNALKQFCREAVDMKSDKRRDDISAIAVRVM